VRKIETNGQAPEVLSRDGLFALAETEAEANAGLAQFKSYHTLVDGRPQWLNETADRVYIVAVAKQQNNIK
jgi:hypothetical protein